MSNTETMRPYKLTVTESFRNLKMQCDDIPWDVFGGGQDYYEIVIKLGNGHEAILLVDEQTVEARPEYFKFVKTNND